MAKTQSRSARWMDAVGEARTAFDTLSNAMGELRAVQEEYEGWRDNLPENLEQSALGEKLEAVCDLDLADVLDQVEEVLGEAEGIDLPQGFGRD